MDAILGLFAFIILALVARKLWRHKTLKPLLPWKYNFGKRRNTMRSTMALLEERGARMLVETGVARRGLEGTRGDGASTIVFGLCAKQNHAFLHSVDIDSDAIARVGELIVEFKPNELVQFHASDSVQFLNTFEDQVVFLYLDSYDYDKSDVDIQRLSQQHHLDEFQAVESRLHQDTVVLIDDCRLPGGGKGKLVIDYLRSKGWILFCYEYQAILLRQLTA